MTEQKEFEVACIDGGCRLEALQVWLTHERKLACGINALAAFRFTAEYRDRYWNVHIGASASMFMEVNGHRRIPCMYQGEIHFRCVEHGCSSEQHYLVRPDPLP